MGLETAAVAAIAGGALSAGGAVTNFVQAGKQRRAAEKAADDAGKALEAARNKLQVNYLKGLSIQKEPYERAREAGISTAAQVLQAAQEGSQRGVAAGATRAQLAQQNLENTNRIAMGQELQGLQRAAALEDRRLQTQQANIDLAEARGFQNMAADARDRQRALNQAGAQGLLGAGQSLMKVPGLYGGGGGGELAQFDPTDASMGKLDRTFNPSETARFFGREIPGVSNITPMPRTDMIIFDDIFEPVTPTLINK